MAYIQYFDGSTEDVEDVVEGSDGERKVTAKVVTTGSVSAEPAASDVAETK